MNIGDSSIFFHVIEQYQCAYEKALEIMNIFEDAEVDELKAQKTILEAEIEKFLNLSDLKLTDCGSLERHLHFMGYYLDKNNKNGAEGDVRDIVFHDLPSVLRKLISNQGTDSHFDQKLRDGVFPLIQGEHYDSAIRKAFVILTERLRRAFGVEEEKDGDDLINLVFGRGGTLAVSLSNGEKTNYRNLISGFYGVYRNKFAHNDIEPTLPEVKAILEMVNNIIIELEEISKKSVEDVT